MSILNGVYAFGEDVVDWKRFTSWNDIERGCFLIRQYIGLVRTFAFKISPMGSEQLDSRYQRTDKGSFWSLVTEHHFLINQFVEELDLFYKSWVQTIDRKSDLSLKLMSAVQWLRQEIHLPLDLKYSDVLFFAEMDRGTKSDLRRNDDYDWSEHLGNLDRDCVFATFYIGSKFRTATLDHKFISYEEFQTNYPNFAGESITLNDPVIATPWIGTEPESEALKLTFSQWSPFKAFTIGCESIYNCGCRSLLEIALLNGDAYRLDLDLIFRLVGSYSIGFDNCEYRNFSHEAMTKLSHNLVWGDENLTLPMFTETVMTSTSWLNTINELIGINNLKLPTSGMLYNTLIETGVVKQLKFSTIGSSGSDSIGPQSGSESINLLNQTNKLLHHLTMEDETEEDNIDEEDSVEGDDIPAEDDFSDDGGMDDSFGGGSDMGSSGGFGGTPEVKPMVIAKNVNIDTNSKKGIKIELDVNPTFDSIMTKDEILVLITNYLNDGKLSNNQKDVLTSMKNMWIGIVTTRTLIDWLEITLKKPIFKRS